MRNWGQKQTTTIVGTCTKACTASPLNYKDGKTMKKCV
jgi:hypothetical protein